MTARSLVIGVGNVDRGDDGAGIHAARLVRKGRVAVSRDCSGLMMMWDPEDHVIVVDATVSGAPPGTIRRFDALAETLPTAAFPSTHSFGLAESIELARALGRLPRELTVYGIEAASFEQGQALTPRVEQAARSVAFMVDAEHG